MHQWKNTSFDSQVHGVPRGTAPASQRTCFFDSQVQGSGDPLHLQVKTNAEALPLQVSGTADSQVHGVPQPTSPASGTELVTMTNTFTCSE